MSAPKQPGPAAQRHRPAHHDPDIDIPFGRLVMFFVKAALAAIPATIIVWFIMAFLAMIFSAIFGFGGGRGWMMSDALERQRRSTRPATASSFASSAGSRADGAVMMALSSARCEPAGQSSRSAGKSRARRAPRAGGPSRCCRA